MTINESDRLALRQELERVLSNPRHAETLMRSLPTTENTDVATRGDLERLGLDLRREIEVSGRALRAEMAELRADMRSEIATVHTGLAEITKQMAVQFRLTLLLQIGVIVAVSGIVAQS